MCGVCMCAPRHFPGREGASGCGGSRLALRCHSQRDISRRRRNQQRGGQSGRLDVYPRSVRKRRLLGFADTTRPGLSPPPRLPLPPSRLAPSGRRPVAIASKPGPQPRSLSIYLPPFRPSVRISPSPLLPSSPKMLPSALFPFSPVLTLPSHLFLSATDTPSRPTQPPRASLSSFLRSRQVFVCCPARRVSSNPSRPYDRACFVAHHVDPR
jgi:hypothetical protein